MRFLGRGVVRFVLLPIYTAFVLLNIRLERVIVSARGLFFFLFTNRYIFHAALLIVSIATIGSQLTTPSASASDSAQNSLLYTLVTQGQDESIEETFYIEPAQGKTSYLGADTIQALPDIDYGYDTDIVADLTIPGSVALMPHGDFPQIEPLPEDPIDTVVATRTQTENYTVQSGDTVATIARRFGVNVGTIVWANNLSRSAAIKPGDTLRIPATSGVFHTVKRGETLGQLAKLYKVEITAITQTNGNLQTLTPGQEILIPGASPITTTVAVSSPASTRTTAASSPVRADIPISKIKNKAVDVYQELRVGEADVRAKPEDKTETAVKSTTKLLWPTDLRVINQYWNTWSHTGIDIDGDYANATYASADGVVEAAGWNNSGYGLMIVINHENGIKTRYAHHSKLFVKVGETVKRGQVIGMVGTTGRSTGTHLHYEVIVNGKRVNPLAYIR